MELLTTLVDSLAFTGKATKDTNHLRSDSLKSRLSAKRKQIARMFLLNQSCCLGSPKQKNKPN